MALVSGFCVTGSSFGTSGTQASWGIPSSHMEGVTSTEAAMGAERIDFELVPAPCPQGYVTWASH